MKKYVLGVALLGLGFGLQAQDLYIKFSGGSDVRYGLTTVERITFSTTDMQVEVGAGNMASYGLDSIAYFNYKGSVVSGIAAKELGGEAAFKLYPNPSTGSLYMDYRGEEGAYELRIVNLSGQEVYRKMGAFSSVEKGLSLELEDLPNGLYIAELKRGFNKQIEKIIIKK